MVSHGGRSKTFDFSAHSAYGMHYAAFYADCNHEVGLRCLLANCVVCVKPTAGLNWCCGWGLVHGRGFGG